MTIDIKMAWRNIWRHPRRTILTVTAIAFACILLVFMLSFQFGSYDTMINSSVKIHTGHLQIQAEGYRDRKNIRYVIPDPAPVERALADIPGVQAYSPRARAFALVSSEQRSYGVMVEGVAPESEARVSTLEAIVDRGQYFDTTDDGDRAGVLLGELLAQNLKVDIGDELTILGQGRDGSIAATVLPVRGIYDSGMDEFDRSAIQIPLPTFQSVFNMGPAVHELVVVADRLSDVPRIRSALQTPLNNIDADRPLKALGWDELMPGLRQAINMDLVSGAVFYLILIMVVAFSILNTFLMAIFERTREFGIMMAIGTRPGRLMRLVLVESIGMTLIGVVAGIAAGCLLTLYFAHTGIGLGESSELLSQFGIPGRLYPQLSLLSATAGPAAVLVITLLAAGYPALKLRRLRPVEAMRRS